MLFIIPLYYQIVIQTDAFGSGLRLLSLVAGLVVGGVMTEITVAKLGEKKNIISGFFLIALATIAGAMTTLDSMEWFVGLWRSEERRVGKEWGWGGWRRGERERDE